jgi:hypothetical protein
MALVVALGRPGLIWDLVSGKCLSPTHPVLMLDRAIGVRSVIHPVVIHPSGIHLGGVFEHQAVEAKMDSLVNRFIFLPGAINT